MAVFNSEGELVSQISPARLYKALAIDSVYIFPKALPNFIKGAEYIEGDGGPGTIKKLTLAHGYAKQRVDEVDVKNYVYRYTVIEGGPLADKFEKISNEYKFVAAPDGGSIIKAKSTYYTKNDEQLTEEFLKAGKQQAAGFVKGVEDYLLANPDYN